MNHSDSPRPLVSLVFPAFNEVENVGAMVEFYREIVTTHPDYRFEMIVVDDGSTDGTAERVIALAAGDSSVRVVSLSRNFGSHAALSAGLAQASGAAAITLSADRQEPLSAIGDFLEQWTAGADLVWGLRSVRVQQAGVQGAFARNFSQVFRRTSELPNFPAEGPSQMLVARPLIDTLNSMPEGNRNLMAMAAWAGFDQRSISYEQLPRPHGTSKWTLRRKIKLVFDSFVEFSRAPLAVVLWTAVVLGVLGVIALLTALVMALLAAPGAATALICGTVLVVGALNLGAVALVAEYVWRAGDDARRRPLYVVKRIAEAGPATVDS